MVERLCFIDNGLGTGIDFGMNTEPRNHAWLFSNTIEAVVDPFDIPVKLWAKVLQILAGYLPVVIINQRVSESVEKTCKKFCLGCPRRRTILRES
ncbi:hypothetical protein K227x_59060 [Rubripirellula lacrimiformis]|uniref:Uncharacterized protein n=1 Tax=Rubripirellula lacrimiformis TaxID=1930273 RepID=A0A517NK78_9BACT|nr:hypothetical protein [Rubripirellula lacrimiformis]QDT07479.1 hypothetical protein K227x_59060 [Rubripirellula lacrimiformis]